MFWPKISQGYSKQHLHIYFYINLLSNINSGFFSIFQFMGLSHSVYCVFYPSVMFPITFPMCVCVCVYRYIILKHIFIDLRERGMGVERMMWEKHWLLPICTATGNWTHSLGVCPDQRWKPQPLVYGMMLQPNEHKGQGYPKYILMTEWRKWIRRNSTITL